MPRTVKAVTRPDSLGTAATPGKLIATSLALMFGKLPNESIAATFLRLGALRCAVMAAAPPSRSPDTLNPSSR